MWRFKPFMQKEPAGLEGRSIDVGNLKIHIRNAIAEGGFSSVYLARDAVQMSKQYALKHIICNDDESLDLVMKEISVMKSLQGHPNVVTLCADAILDMGRTKEALLVMEFCEKSLVNVLESRGAGYFDEKQVLLIFRDVCNAVFSMHCQSPPVAHRDLKAENILLGPDGSWKLCDFGSTSTNHKRFEKPEEMGIEEDNIRKYTTPAYRAPEMWDLFRRELINEKVDIWALGCLLFRICYFKNAFDGESKLQILNGNYRIPELPKYGSSITDLIRDMLHASPEDRPDITQVWFRVNDLLPVALQKSLPDRPPGMNSSEIHEGNSRAANRSSPMPCRSPPSPPSSLDSTRDSSQILLASKAGGGGAQLGAFWSTQHAKNSLTPESKREPKFDEEPTSHSTLKHDRIRPDNHPLPKKSGTEKDEHTQAHPVRRNLHGNSLKAGDVPPKDFEISFFQKERDHCSERPATFQDEAFNTFVAEFDNRKLSSGIANDNLRKEEALEPELEKLKEQLKQANLEKAEISSKFEKLSAICRSQRQEIQELKQALAARTPSPNKDPSRNQISPGVRPSSTPPQEKANWNKPSTETQTWQAFTEESTPQQPTSVDSTVKSVRTRNGQQNKQASKANAGFESWGFGAESFTAAPAGSSQTSRPIGVVNKSQSMDEANSKHSKSASQPAGWAGF